MNLSNENQYTELSGIDTESPSHNKYLAPSASWVQKELLNTRNPS